MFFLNMRILTKENRNVFQFNFILAHIKNKRKAELKTCQFGLFLFPLQNDRTPAGGAGLLLRCSSGCWC